jgi:hypothetical protein
MVPVAAPFAYGSTPESAFRATPTHTERRTAHRRDLATQNGTYVLVALEAQIAGSALRLTLGSRVVLCGSGASMTIPRTGNLCVSGSRLRIL